MPKFCLWGGKPLNTVMGLNVYFLQNSTFNCRLQHQRKIIFAWCAVLLVLMVKRKVKSQSKNDPNPFHFARWAEMKASQNNRLSLCLKNVDAECPRDIWGKDFNDLSPCVGVVLASMCSSFSETCFCVYLLVCKAVSLSRVWEPRSHYLSPHPAAPRQAQRAATRPPDTQHGHSVTQTRTGG